MSPPVPLSDRARLALLRVDRSAALGLAVLAAVAVAVAVFLTWQGRPHEVTYTGDGSAAAGAPVATASGVEPASPQASAVGSASGVVVVDVTGRVRRPGLVRVPTGSRVADVVEAAGGFTRAKDAAALNQARVVSDGEQVVVGPGVPGSGGGVGAGGGSAGGGASGSETGGPVDLNTATLEQLESLPGVGPVLAQRILEHRTANGRFGSVDELRDVSGIGEKKFADIAPHARV